MLTFDSKCRLNANSVQPICQDAPVDDRADHSTHKVYFDYGTATLDALYEPFQLQADAIMKQKGYTDGNCKTLKFEGAEHSEKA